MSEEVVAIICARGGSKGIPRKNLKNFYDTPLIEWAVRAARNADHVDNVIVSSDDDEILEFVKKLEVFPHLRPDRLATDVSTVEVGVLDVLQNNPVAKNAKLIVLVQATSPLTRSSDIDSAIEKIERNNLDSILSVSSSHNFHWQVHDNRS